MKAMKIAMQGDPAFLGLREDENRGLGFELSAAFLNACTEVNKGNVTFRTSQDVSESFGDRFVMHPDRLPIQKWLAARNADSGEYEVIILLCNHVISEWNVLPKRTATQHRNLFAEIEATAARLGSLIKQTDADYYRGGGYGLRDASVAHLLTETESAMVDEQWKVTHSEHGGQLDPDFRSAMPTFEDLLIRVGQAANRLSTSGPIHTQPNKRGAERGFFVRRIGALFMQRYKECPAEVIASVTTIALNEVTDRELVAKLLK